MSPNDKCASVGLAKKLFRPMSLTSVFVGICILLGILVFGKVLGWPVVTEVWSPRSAYATIDLPCVVTPDDLAPLSRCEPKTLMSKIFLLKVRGKPVYTMSLGHPRHIIDRAYFSNPEQLTFGEEVLPEFSNEGKILGLHKFKPCSDMLYAIVLDLRKSAYVAGEASDPTRITDYRETTSSRKCEPVSSDLFIGTRRDMFCSWRVLVAMGLSFMLGIGSYHFKIRRFFYKMKE